VPRIPQGAFLPVLLRSPAARSARRTAGVTLVLVVLISFASSAIAQSGGPLTPADFREARAPYNPKPFQNNLASPSAPIVFLLSERGQMLAAAHSNTRGLLTRWGVSLPKLPAPAQAASIATVNTPPVISQAPEGADCNSPAGARFNLEPKTGSPQIGFRAPQNEESVDFIASGGMDGADLVIEGANDYRGLLDSALSSVAGTWGLSVTGYYVHRAGADCHASFEGGLPHLVYTASGETLFGMGDPVIAVDATRGLIYAEDLRFSNSASALGLFATTASTLNSTASCPNGTHLLDANGNDTTSAACWPTRVLFNPQPAGSVFIDKPHLRVDDRAAGIGAGNVYLTWSRFDLASGASQIQLAVCPANFAAECSAPINISSDDPQTQFSHIAVRPDGVITVTYVNINVIPAGIQNYARQTFDIKYVSCTPNGAPAAPTCSAPSLITTEKTPLAFGGTLAANIFRVQSYPTHDNRLKDGAYEEFVAWSRCKTDPYLFVGTFLYLTCTDSQLVMTWSATDSAGKATGWSYVSAVNNHVGDQIMPWVKTDHSRDIVHVTYLSSEQDPFRHRFNVLDNEIPLLHHAPDPPIFITSTPSEPSDDPILGPGFIGDYIGAAAKGNGATSRAYIGFTSQFYKGLLYGVPVSGQDNLISRIDY
jgi:hypothetical protein